MASLQLRILIHHLRRSVIPEGEDTLSDAQLLERWITQRDEAAFEVLLWRHGTMVLSVCRRLLRDSHDVEDAFQAAFLTLVSKGKSIRRPETLAAWLYRVAYRIALRLRGEAAERDRREQGGVETLPDVELDEAAQRDLRAVVDEEIDALPERYRQAFVLCYLQGRSHEEAARLLGRPTGTVSCWLKRGRERLRHRLARRGLAPALALAAVGPSEAPAALTPPLVKATGRAAALLALGTTSASPMISARVAALVEAAVAGMTATKLHWTAVLVLALSLTATGAGIWAFQPSAVQRPVPKQQARTTEPPRQRDEQAVRNDRYGDPLPEGTIARLGTVRLRAVGARVGLSPDGKTIIGLIGGRQVQCWDADSGKARQRRELPFPPAPVELSQWFLSPDGRLLGGQEGGFDGPINFYDVATGKRLHQLRRLPPRTGIYRAAFSPDGKMFVMSEMNFAKKPVIRLWDLASEKQRELKGHTQSAESLVFSRDSKLLAATDGRTIICWDIANDEKLWQRKCAYGVTLGFTPDGRTLIGSPGHQERAWHTWNVATGTRAPGLKLPEGYNYARLAVAPDGRTLVFAQGRNVQGADGRIRLWDLRKGQMLHTLPAGGAIGPFFPDGKSFLTNDGSLQRWELATGRPLLPDTEKLGHHAEVTRAVYSPDGRRLASIAGDGTIRLWDVAAAKPLHVLRGRDRDTTDTAFTPDGKFLVSGGMGFTSELCVWDTQSGKEVRRIPRHDPQRKETPQNIWQLHLTPDGRTILVLGYNPDTERLDSSILSRWDRVSGERKGRVDIASSDGFYAGFSPDGRLLASHGQLWDTTTGKARVKLQGEPGFLPHYVFSPEGRRVAGHLTRTVTEGNRTTTKMEGIAIWDAETGRMLQLLATDWVGQLAFSPDGRYLTAADLQGLRLWELASGKVVLKHKAHERMHGSYGQSFASCLSFAPDGRSLATGHPDSTILLWNLVPSGKPPAAEELPRLWADLIAGDAARAYAASWRLTGAPRETAAFLRERMRPVSAAPAEQVRQLLADLDSDEFAKREAAATRLRELGDRAAGALKKAQQARPSLEMRRRLDDLLANLEKPPTGELLQQLRAVAVLERIGTDEARQVLQALAHGLPEARLTRDARATLERLTLRGAAEKR